MTRLPPDPTSGVRRPERTYVVLQFPATFATDQVVPLGTVRAANRHEARSLATALAAVRRSALAARRGRQWAAHEFPGVAVRWRVASACRRTWLLEALARDAAASRGER